MNEKTIASPTSTPSILRSVATTIGLAWLAERVRKSYHQLNRSFFGQMVVIMLVYATITGIFFG